MWPVLLPKKEKYWARYTELSRICRDTGDFYTITADLWEVAHRNAYVSAFPARYGNRREEFTIVYAKHAIPHISSEISTQKSIDPEKYRLLKYPPIHPVERGFTHYKLGYTQVFSMLYTWITHYYSPQIQTFFVNNNHIFHYSSH